MFYVDRRTVQQERGMYEDCVLKVMKPENLTGGV